MEVKDYIKHYKKALDPSLCRNIIDLGKKESLERWEQKGRPQWNMFNTVSYTHLRAHETS